MRTWVAGLALAALAALAVPAYSYATMLRQPSNLPVAIRTVEWLRANHSAWLVDAGENVYFSATTPVPGGPQLAYLPRVGVEDVRASESGRWDLPGPISPLIGWGLAGEGVWRASTVATGAPAVLETVFRPDPAYPRHVAYVAWIDTRSTQLALYQGRREPPRATPRGPMEVPSGQRRRLLATFNSGFKYKDCLGGFVVNGVTHRR